MQPLLLLLLRTLMAACCWVFLPPWQPAGAKPMNLQRVQFVLGEHASGETVLEMVDAAAGWYEGHPVQLAVQYPASTGGDERVRLVCVEVVIYYAAPGSSSGTSGGPTTDDAYHGPRVQFVSGGLGQSYATVSIVAPAVTYFNHSTVFYGAPKPNR